MLRIFKFLQKKLNLIFRISLFLVVLLIILFIFPNIQRFKYEYKKGTPWKSETLYSPFNFAIKKSEHELQTEREKILESFKPFFNYDNKILTSKLNELQRYLPSDSIVQNFILKEIEQIYNVGIVNPETQNFPKLKKIVKLIKNNVAEEIKLENFYTVSTAYQQFTNNIALSNFGDIPNINTLLDNENIFVPNVDFDQEFTEKSQADITKDIIENRGVVQINERIISKGDIVDENTYRILESLKLEYTKRIGSSEGQNYIIAGQLILIFFCILILFLYISNFRTSVMQSIKQLLLILLFLLGYIAITIFILRYPSINVYVIPYALMVIVVRTFVDNRTAIISYIITILLASYLIGYEFMFIQLIAGFIAILSLNRLQKRSQLFYTALYIFFTYSILYFAFTITQEGSLENFDYKIFFWFAINGGLLTIAYLLIYVIEKIFGFLSDITLIELSNTNNKLLRKLTQVAPGTFQHSMQVANLAEEAVYTIGKGNPLLIRAGGLYHDIGKMKNPAFFIENQHINFNPHSNLSYQQSATIIIEHVPEGVRIAKRYKLPQQVIDFIKTHHGFNMTEYFYRSQKKDFPDEDIDKSIFTYPGPDPFTLEQAILMMADTCEAASRSLKEKTKESIHNLVNELIDNQLKNGRFNNAPINFQDITVIKDIFIKKIMNIYHVRVSYPENPDKK